jgi:hypothetical protein
VAKDTPPNGNTTPSSLNDSILADLKVALELVVNSTEQSDALLEVFKAILTGVLTRGSARRKFLECLQTIIDEYGV